ncbi:MAG: hypothetical protein Q8P67_29375, partial [archaeon]|nr:hypothetical protein [archaeon]
FDAKIAPYGHLSDGAMDVVVIRKGASKPALAEFLVALEEGTHLVGSEIHEYYKASALVLEPEGGMIGIDGERTPNTPIACNVLHGAIRLLGAHP